MIDDLLYAAIVGGISFLAPCLMGWIREDRHFLRDSAGMGLAMGVWWFLLNDVLTRGQALVVLVVVLVVIAMALTRRFWLPQARRRLG
jgi:hypothetical protein